MIDVSFTIPVQGKGVRPLPSMIQAMECSILLPVVDSVLAHFMF